MSVSNFRCKGTQSKIEGWLDSTSTLVGSRWYLVLTTVASLELIAVFSQLRDIAQN